MMLCSRHDGTERVYCVDQRSLRESADGSRSAPLYIGGAMTVHPSTSTALADCRGEVLYFLDTKGAAYWGSAFTLSSIAPLGAKMCSALLPDAAAPRR